MRVRLFSPIAARPRLRRLFDFLKRRAEQDNYPPFDIEKLGDDLYRITLAVAGFKREEIEIVAHQNVLTISGRRGEDRGRDGSFLHMGIANRSFERRFELADFVFVTGADLKDGLLSIELAREIPEAMKPRKVEIGGRCAETIEASPRSPKTGRSSRPKRWKSGAGTVRAGFARVSGFV